MAKYEDIKKANDEQKSLNKSMEDGVKAYEDMSKKYNSFADKRKKEARDYKKLLEEHEIKLAETAERLEEIKETKEDLVKEYKETLSLQGEITDADNKRSKFLKEQSLIAETISGFDKSGLVMAQAKEAFANGDLDLAKSRLDLANNQSEVLQGIATGELSIADVLKMNEDLSQSILENDSSGCI